MRQGVELTVEGGPQLGQLVLHGDLHCSDGGLDILDSGRVGAPHVHDSLHQVSEVQGPALLFEDVFEDEIKHLDQNIHINVHAIQEVDNLRLADELEHGLLGNWPVEIDAQLLHGLAKRRGHRGDLQALALRGRHDLDDVDHHTHQHVHHGHGGHEDEQHGAGPENGMPRGDLVDELGIVSKEALEQQGIHHREHGIKVRGEAVRWLSIHYDGKLLHDKCKEVDQYQAEDSNHQHGPAGRPHGFDHDAELRDGTEELGHPREPQDLHHANDSQR
mmetsp:Transcript_110668/g.263899  ORF Transcript_110668/g.263899 Transcript_110668/m.263899 type:complete len:274 (+) Transcript_110668:144-965(+)